MVQGAFGAAVGRHHSAAPRGPATSWRRPTAHPADENTAAHSAHARRALYVPKVAEKQGQSRSPKATLTRANTFYNWL